MKLTSSYTSLSFSLSPICWSDFIYKKNIKLTDPKAPQNVEKLLIGNTLDGQETNISFFHLAVTQFCYHSYHLKNREKWMRNGGYGRARHERMRELGWMLDDDSESVSSQGEGLY